MGRSLPHTPDRPRSHMEGEASVVCSSMATSSVESSRGLLFGDPDHPHSSPTEARALSPLTFSRQLAGGGVSSPLGIHT